MTGPTGYIQTKGALHDHLVFMAAVLPGDVPDQLQMTIETAFAELAQGLVNTRDQLGKDRLRKCLTMAEQSRAAYESGDQVKGESLLYSIVEALVGHTLTVSRGRSVT
jgi:hypothetical protein